MKRLLLPSILIVMILSVLFVSCAKNPPLTETETMEELNTTVETGTDSGDTTTTTKVLPTYSTNAAATTTKKTLLSVLFPEYTTTAATTTTTTTATTTTKAPTSTTKNDAPTSTTKKADSNNKPSVTTGSNTNNQTGSTAPSIPEVTAKNPGVGTTHVPVTYPSRPLDPGCKHLYTYATCTEPRICTKCNGTMGEPLGHTHLNPTCNQPGPCQNEGCTSALPALGKDQPDGHDYSDPTCSKPGECRNGCGATPIPALGKDQENGHSYKQKRVNPTCTDKGYTIYTCTECGYVYNGNYKDPLGHDYESKKELNIVTDPTCTEDGYTTFHCSRSGCGYSEVGATVSALGHKYNHVVTAPDCTEAGYTTHSCITCGHSYIDSHVDARGHNYGEGNVSCVLSVKCQNEGCNELKKGTGHNFVGNTCTEKVTCSNPGCGAEKGPYGHSYENGICTRCGTSVPSATPGDNESPVVTFKPQN